MYFDFYYAIVFFIVFICSLLIVGILLLKFNAKNNLKKLLIQSKLNEKEVLFPMKVKAVERYALYLERIKVENLVTRIKPVSEDLQHYKLFLSATIEQEFNHNAVQKIHISNATFQSVEFATQSVLEFLNNSTKSNTSSITEFTTNLISNNAHINSKIDTALLQLKKELNN